MQGRGGSEKCCHLRPTLGRPSTPGFPLPASSEHGHLRKIQGTSSYVIQEVTHNYI